MHLHNAGAYQASHCTVLVAAESSKERWLSMSTYSSFAARKRMT